MKRLLLADDEVAVFGYGSLMLKESIEKTLGRTYSGPMEPALLKGWKRSWSVKCPNSCFHYKKDGEEGFPEHILYLNVKEESEEAINGVVFVLKESELAAFDERESVYDRVHVSDSMSGCCVGGKDIYTYRAKEEAAVANPHAVQDGVIRKSYINMVYKALDSLGKEFFAKYHASTESLPEHLVVDDFKKTDV